MSKFKYKERVEIVKGFYIGYTGKVMSIKPGMFSDKYFIEFDSEELHDQLLNASDLTSIDNTVFSEKLEKIVSEEE